jgi:YesN/AraC family two-component response regulator
LAPAKLLLVDDDEVVLSGLKSVLEAYDFEVTVASNVVDALRRIAGDSFDVLLSDLHMPGPGDGLTVVSAMRHANPRAVTILLSAYPDMRKAVSAILAQADEIMVKPVKAGAIAKVIRERLAQEPRGPRMIESIANLIERESDSVVQTWLTQTAQERELMALGLSEDDRTEHLPHELRDISFRLRYPQPLGSRALFSMAALQHGARRRRQGYTAAMMVEESRILQVALFHTIQKNMDRIDLSQLADSLMSIADEVNSQFSQALMSYGNEYPIGIPPQTG